MITLSVKTRLARAVSRAMKTTFLALAILFFPCLCLAQTQEPQNVYDTSGNYTGSVKPEGSAGNANVYNRRGTYQGRIDESGNVYDRKGKLVGSVK